MQNNLPKYILTKENSLREDPNGNITFVAQAMEFAKLHAADAKTAWAECEALREKVAALEAALSPAEPYGWMVKTKGSPWKGTFYSSEPLFGQGVWDREDYEITPVFAAPPAPSVAVKALEALLSAVKASVHEKDEPHRVILKDGTAVTGEIADRWLNFMRLIREVCEKALSAQVQDVARDLPSEFEKWWDGADYGSRYVGGVVKMTYTQRKQLAWDAFYASAKPAAPAKQEG